METPILFPMPQDEYWKKLSQLLDESINKRLHQDKTIVPPVNGLTARPFLSMKEVCELFRITKPTIYSWTKGGKLKPYKIRARVYFLTTDIENLLKPAEDNHLPNA
jgi:excisionase family DNA binding protein